MEVLNDTSIPFGQRLQKCLNNFHTLHEYYDKVAPLDDKTLDFLSSAEFMVGIFQLNKKVSANLLRKLIPSLKRIHNLTKEDVILLLSDISTLIRPGCSEEVIERYIKRRLGKKNAYVIDSSNTYFNIWFNAVEDTYYELLYQEQLMIFLADLFDISLGKADTLRRDLEKKDLDKLNQYKENYFKENKIEGKQKEDFETIWEYLLESAGYLFNKSHSVCYSFLTYSTAYYKANYPELFYASYMNVKSDNFEIKAELLAEFKQLGDIQLPKLGKFVNETTARLKGDKYIMQVAPNSLKGFGKSLLKEQYYSNVNEFLNKNKGLKKNQFEILIALGFFSDYFKSIKEAWDYIYNYKIETKERREKKFVKVRKGMHYSPKKGETIIEDYPDYCIVKIETPFKAISEYPFEYKSDQLIQLEKEAEHLGLAVSNTKLQGYDFSQLIIVNTFKIVQTRYGEKLVVTDYNNKQHWLNPNVNVVKNGIYMKERYNLILIDQLY